MYETKLANSIQMDYRQAADNHRLAKAVAPKTSIPVKAIAITALVVASTLVMALQPIATYACGLGNGGGC